MLARLLLPARHGTARTRPPAGRAKIWRDLQWLLPWMPPSCALPRHVLLARAVATFAGNAQHKICLVVAVHQRRWSKRLKICRMALDAPRYHRPVKIRRAVQVSGTIDPLVQFGPIRNGQFKKLIAFPVQVRLTLMSGADYDAKLFRMLLRVGRLADDRRLEKMSVALLHFENQRGIERLQNVPGRRKTSRDGLDAGQRGSAMMNGELKRSEFVLVARAAHRVSDVACVPRCLYRVFRRPLAPRRRWPAFDVAARGAEAEAVATSRISAKLVLGIGLLFRSAKAN